MAARFPFLTIIIICLAKSEDLFRIPEEISSHENWKLLDNGDDCGTFMANRIIGGREARLGQYPWMARLGYSSEPGYYTATSYECGGSIINEKYILTAAHCGSEEMATKGKTLVSVRLGEHYTNLDKDCVENECADPVQDIDVEEEICHSNYDYKVQQDDICLLRLAKPIIYNDYVSSVCLPAFDFMLNNTFEGDLLEVAGWGATDAGNLYEGSNALMMLKVPVSKHKLCIITYEHMLDITSKQMCAGGELGKDSCVGDSGGPLMKVCSVNSIARNFIIGITSTGPEYCGTLNVPALYTVVAEYWPWILDNIRA